MDETESESWTMNHFSLSLPSDTDLSNVPALLRHVANAIEVHGPIEVQDIVFHTDVTADGYEHSMTIYFHPATST